jgi:hypothetical protein
MDWAESEIASMIVLLDVWENACRKMVDLALAIAS